MQPALTPLFPLQRSAVLSRLSRRLWPLVGAVLLSACGGGSGGGERVEAAASCSVADQKAWLGRYMDDWYFWYRLAPQPAGGAYPTLAEYFSALLYKGTAPTFPADRWSNTETTESFNRFYGDGQSMGYGVAVAGREVLGRPAQPLYVRLVEPQSAAGMAGVMRGDQVVSINGRASADVIASNDFSGLSASAEGQSLTTVLRNAAGGQRSVVMVAKAFALTPVPLDTVVATAAGRRLGYVQVKDMISQVNAPLEAAFARFRAAGVQGLVLDLRYNGGGLVSVASSLGSYVAGARGEGRAFASLLYNDKRAGSNNTVYRFANPASALGVARVYVLMGSRTCSASDQVINGLRGAGVEVVTIGEASCGKPVGFLPSSQCGTTYNVVNFESVNERNEGRYFDGFAATCPVAEDFTRALGTPAEPLLAAAIAHADTGACPAVASGQAQALGQRARADGHLPRTLWDGGGLPGMLDR